MSKIKGEYLECSKCGAVFIKIKNELWKCKRCGNGGLVRDLRQYINKNPEKIRLD